MRNPLKHAAAIPVLAAVTIATIGINTLARASTSTTPANPAAATGAVAPATGPQVKTGKPIAPGVLQCDGGMEESASLDYVAYGPRDKRSPDEIVATLAAMEAPSYRLDGLATVYKVTVGAREVARDMVHRDTAGKVTFWASLREHDELGLVVEQYGACAS